MKTIRDLGALNGKTVLVRADFNVPLEGKMDGQKITDDGRIRAALPTLKQLLDDGAKIVIAAHLGRPKGSPDPKFSLAPVAARLQELAGVKVHLAKDSTGESAKSLVKTAQPGEIVLLENIRFDARETSKDDAEREALAKELAELADVFVSDGFGVVHRKQASVYDVAKLLPAGAGLLVQKEVEALSKVTKSPDRPLVVILGGSKVSDKIGVIDNMLSLADAILIGGGMTYTFFKALGFEVGQSLLEADQIENAKAYIDKAAKLEVKFMLPLDNVVTKEFAPESTGKVVKADEIPDELQALDIGPETVKIYGEEILRGKTIVWNGPVGVFEFEHFEAGTRGIAKALAEATEYGAYTVIGGGDSAAAVRKFGYPDSAFSHISTGGGASLEFLEGKTLPGLA
ncbi:MAG: phosphoglycerate kinase, partial [Bifidobacteriaceae bacterium]|nr:phosphoglycerate kinase [Bifidobacteriaceae bacterium]